MAPLETETWLEVFAREREEREALTKALEQHGQNKAALSDSYQHEKAAVEARHEQELVDLAARHKEEMTQLAAQHEQKQFEHDAQGSELDRRCRAFYVSSMLLVGHCPKL